MTMSCHFIGYLDTSKGFHFYCPQRYTKIVEMRYIIFLEDEVIRGNMVPRDIRLEEKQVYVPTPMVAKPFFLGTYYCYTHNTGQCGYRTHCTFCCDWL
jgi:hypothetical protein